MALRIVSNMSRPLSGSRRKCGRDGPRSERAPPGWSETGGFRALSFRLGGLRSLRLLGQAEEHGGGRHEHEIEIKERTRYEREANNERIQRELCHLGVAG